MIELREEISSDVQPIHQVTELAFRGRPYAGGDEQDVVDRLRAQNALTLSLVAIEAGELVGQVTFSPAELSNGSGLWYALGPVSVTPQLQSEGIGASLINLGLEKITAMGALGCILTGNPAYYTRFGFKLSPKHAPDNEPEAFFMLKLMQDVQPEGRFAFHQAFYGA